MAGLLHRGGCLRAGQHRQRLIQQGSRQHAEQRLDIGTDLLDEQLGTAEGHQNTVGLNGPRKTNGLVSAVGQQDLKIFSIQWVHNNTS